MYRSLYGAFMLKLRTILRHNLINLRNSSGLTQSDLAEKADLSIRTIQKIEYGEMWPSDDVVVKIAGALNVETYLLYMPQQDPETMTLITAIGTLSPSMAKIIRGMIEEVHSIKNSSRKLVK